MAENNVIINPRYMHYNSKQAQALLDQVQDRSFLRDMTEDEYEALPKSEQENGDLYLIHEEEDE